MEPDKAVIWDLDGVIADTAPFHFQAWKELVERRGRNFTREDFRHSFGLRNETILKSIFGELSAEEIESLSREKEELFRQKVKGNIKSLPGVLKLLRTLKREKFKIGLVSSTPIENINLILSSLKISGYFDCLISAKDVQRGKPDPEGFLLAAKKLGVEPKYCIVIEDAVAGVEAAKAAGMKCIALTTTHPRDALAKADLVVDNLEGVGKKELRHLLFSTWGDSK